jgi:hypothetical protein
MAGGLVRDFPFDQLYRDFGSHSSGNFSDRRSNGGVPAHDPLFAATHGAHRSLGAYCDAVDLSHVRVNHSGGSCLSATNRPALASEWYRNYKFFCVAHQCHLEIHWGNYAGRAWGWHWDLAANIAGAARTRCTPYRPCRNTIVDRRTPGAALQRELTAFDLNCKAGTAGSEKTLQTHECLQLADC